MRRVEYYEYELNQETNKWEKKLMGEATFQTFGVDCAELNNGVGTFTTAIIELDDGNVKNLPVQQVRFLPLN